ncbi:hypothetical protein H0A64_07105 [Alcaligenaceae bacterium]|nr:hypothetical protein [Alcaligenaceae bacterium]
MTVALRQQLPPMPVQAVDQVREFENVTRQCPQINVQTEHTLHAGMYARTIRLPAGVVLTGVLIKIPTTVIVHGICRVFTGERFMNLAGYHVIAAGAGRKQIFITQTDTVITMIFPSTAQTVEQAENEFTDEAHLLMSRNDSGE